jgi:hypothetical protein
VFVFADPSICNTLFAAFICKEVTEGHSILAADNRVMCEDLGHQILQLCSAVLIALVACGVPIGAAAFLRRVHNTRPPVDVGLQRRLASDFNITLTAAKVIIRDVQFGSSYGFLVAAYRSGSPMYLWESVDSELTPLALFFVRPLRVC